MKSKVTTAIDNRLSLIIDYHINFFENIFLVVIFYYQAVKSIISR